MPYYCTVPRCTSMAGKVKNVSFHQFPRDEELASLWNKILKRGKPYTKYSKVCSLHFTPDDYTITNAGKYKGQWRTLRKDAIPSRNLPIEAPAPYAGRDSSSWSPVTNTVDPRLHQQMAQAIYVQTMLAMQAAGVTDVGSSMFSNDQQMSSPNTDRSRSPTSNPSEQLSYNFDPIDKILHKHKDIHTDEHTDSISAELDNTDDKDRVTDSNVVSSSSNTSFTNGTKMTYRCNECSKCFKDPDVYILHKRIHNRNESKSSVEKEILGARNNVDSTQETLKANPILANLLNSGIPQGTLLAQSDTEVGKAFDTSIVSIESQIMTALAANMENYLRNLSSIMTNSNLIEGKIGAESIKGDENVDDNAEDDDVDDEGPNFDYDLDEKNDNCDKKDLDDSQDSGRLVIDEDKC